MTNKKITIIAVFVLVVLGFGYKTYSNLNKQIKDISARADEANVKADNIIKAVNDGTVLQVINNQVQQIQANQKTEVKK